MVLPFKLKTTTYLLLFILIYFSCQKKEKVNCLVTINLIPIQENKIKDHNFSSDRFIKFDLKINNTSNNTIKIYENLLQDDSIYITTEVYTRLEILENNRFKKYNGWIVDVDNISSLKKRNKIDIEAKGSRIIEIISNFKNKYLINGTYRLKTYLYLKDLGCKTIESEWYEFEVVNSDVYPLDE